MYDVLVVGGGPAGVVAALRCGELGAKVALVERERMGGTCTNDGCVPTRVLARTARLMRDSQQFFKYGLISESPVLDFPSLLKRTQHVVYSIHEKKQLIKHLQNSGVDVYSEAGPAQFIDTHTISLNGNGNLYAEKFILCVGGHARQLEFPGAEHTITHSEVWSLKSAPQSGDPC